MKVICSWCRDVIRDDDFSGQEVSHGICATCRDIYYPKMGKRKRFSAAPPRQDNAFLLSGKALGTFSHWPKVDFGVTAKGDW